MKLYDATLYEGRPDPAEWGAHPLRMVYRSYLWPGGDNSDRVPSEEVLDAVVESSRGQALCIDIEHWPYDVRKESDTDVEATIDRLAEITDSIRRRDPAIRLGFYGLMPIRDYWTPQKTGEELDARMADWASANARLRLARNAHGRFESEGLSSKVDVIFPSLYTFYDNRGGWERYAVANLKEARRYDKQVYPFIWPFYHNSNATLRGQYIGDDYLRQQLDICNEHADGMVIWGGYREPWSNAEAKWLPVAREFGAQ